MFTLVMMKQLVIHRITECNIGVPPVIIHFRWGCSLINHRLKGTQCMEIPILIYPITHPYST